MCHRNCGLLYHEMQRWPDDEPPARPDARLARGEQARTVGEGAVDQRGRGQLGRVERTRATIWCVGQIGVVGVASDKVM